MSPIFMKIDDMVNDFREFPRELRLAFTPNPRTGSAVFFLWGPRQTGKTTLLRARYPEARFYDLLDQDLTAELSVRPHLFREQILGVRPDLVVVDEVQRIPVLLEEVHWLLENTPTRFILCGSSARKLRRGAHNLLGGRARDFFLLPLTTPEIGALGEPDLGRLLRHGALPVHYLVDDPAPLLRSYVANYLKAEIIDEAATRNVPAFSRFLAAVGLAHGQQINYAAMARESGVAPATVRGYFQILEETLLGFTLEPWRRRQKRRLVETAKFYLFDVGVANHVHPEGPALAEGSDRFGFAFETFILGEVRAYLAYRGIDLPLAFWRTSSGFEVDLIVGSMEAAIECKAARHVRSTDLKGLRALLEEHRPKRSLVVATVAGRRRTEDGIEILPWRTFCRELWAGELI